MQRLPEVPPRSGHEVLRYMTQAYEAAREGKVQRTFNAWEKAWGNAETNERAWLNTVERPALMRQAYEISARNWLHFAWFIYDREQESNKKEQSFTEHERRREVNRIAWEKAIAHAYAHALECNHYGLRTLIREAQRKPLSSYLLTRIKKGLTKEGVYELLRNI